jgi:site-specific DNA-methyltransferase (adenine-specific)
MTEIDLRLGRWQDVLADVGECDALITDPPYGARTHAKQEHSRREGGHLSQNGEHWISTRGLGYAHWTAEDARAFVASWAPRTRGWIVIFTSHDLVDAYSAALEASGRYVFAPLPAVQRGMNVRLAGDGPSSWTTWVIVSRTAALAKWRTLPGAYVGSPLDAGEVMSDKSKRAVAGGKPLWLMRALVRDYSRAGDVIVDPCAGGATTLLAAATEGRRAVGAEMDPDTHALACKRLAKGYTPDMFAAAPRPPTHEQAALLFGGNQHVPKATGRRVK